MKWKREVVGRGLILDIRKGPGSNPGECISIFEWNKTKTNSPSYPGLRVFFFVWFNMYINFGYASTLLGESIHTTTQN